MVIGFLLVVVKIDDLFFSLIFFKELNISFDSKVIVEFVFMSILIFEFFMEIFIN